MSRAFAISTPLLLAVLALAGCAGHADEDESRAVAARPEVSVQSIAWRSFERVTEAPGQWRSGAEVAVDAPFDAVIETLTPHPGDRVERGEVLGTWRTWESAAALEGAQLLAREARDTTDGSEARRALDQARAGVVRVPIRAPVGGVVVRRSANPGARLAAGAELLALVAEGDLVFEARVQSADAPLVHAGSSASIEGSAAPARAATVVSVLPSAGSDQATLVWLRASGAGPAPLLGQFGRAVIRLGGPERWLAVPDSAVVEEDLTGQHRIAVIDSAGRLAWRAVTLGGRDGRWRAIRGPGLTAGARVVVEGQWALPDGSPVRVRP